MALKRVKNILTSKATVYIFKDSPFGHSHVMPLICFNLGLLNAFNLINLLIISNKVPSSNASKELVNIFFNRGWGMCG